jgi:hypothetical protein
VSPNVTWEDHSIDAHGGGGGRGEGQISKHLVIKIQ